MGIGSRPNPHMATHIAAFTRLQTRWTQSFAQLPSLQKCQENRSWQPCPALLLFGSTPLRFVSCDLDFYAISFASALAPPLYVTHPITPHLTVCAGELPNRVEWVHLPQQSRGRSGGPSFQRPFKGLCHHPHQCKHRNHHLHPTLLARPDPDAPHAAAAAASDPPALGGGLCPLVPTPGPLPDRLARLALLAPAPHVSRWRGGTRPATFPQPGRCVYRL